MVADVFVHISEELGTVFDFACEQFALLLTLVAFLIFIISDKDRWFAVVTTRGTNFDLNYFQNGNSSNRLFLSDYSVL